MAKLKTKKAKLSMREGINAILQSHGIDLHEEILEPLLDDFIIYFNETYKPDNSTPYWSELVIQYMDIYLEIVGEKPAFNPIQAINLKRLSKILQNRFLKVNTTSLWTKDICLKQHDLFYRNAIQIPFYKNSFSVAMLYSKFDEICSQLSALKQKEKEINDKILDNL